MRKHRGQEKTQGLRCGVKHCGNTWYSAQVECGYERRRIQAAEGIHVANFLAPFGDSDVPKGFAKNGDTIKAQIAERMMDLTLTSKERWESQMSQMKGTGKEIDESITYEDIKRFHENKAYTIKVTRERHIRMEFDEIKAILPLLDGRKWLIVRSSEETGTFITSDHPVNLTWKEPEKIPPFYRNSPGFGLKSTQVYFPLSRHAALIGEFDGPEGEIIGTRELIAALNSKILWYTYKQLYAPKLNFHYIGKGGEILDGRHFLKHMSGRGDK